MSNNLRRYIIRILITNIVFYLIFRLFSGKSWKQQTDINTTWTNINEIQESISWTQTNSSDMKNLLNDLLK